MDLADDDAAVGEAAARVGHVDDDRAPLQRLREEGVRLERLGELHGIGMADAPEIQVHEAGMCQVEKLEADTVAAALRALLDVAGLEQRLQQAADMARGQRSLRGELGDRDLAPDGRQQFQQLEAVMQRVVQTSRRFRISESRSNVLHILEFVKRFFCHRFCPFSPLPSW